MKLTLLLFFSIYLFLPASLFPQNAANKTDLIAGTFKSFFRNYDEQKIILQTDRQLYITGEKIWFKAFVLNAYTQKIDLSSKNLFTDLVDDNDQVISKLVLDNQQLKTGGAIVLPDTLRTGFYWLRSYTAKMLQHPENIFIQPVFVLNKSLHDETSFASKYSNKFSNKNISPVVQFFPERLTGLPNIISTGVLKIATSNNNPIIINGTITDGNDSVVATFSTNRFGLSRVTFLNDPTSEYTAIFNFNGDRVRYKMPSVDHHAAQLSIANQTVKNVKAFVTLEDRLPANFQTLILGIHGDSLCYAAVGNGTYGTEMSLENFPGGISSLLLFDQNQHLLDERSIYIGKENNQVEIKTDQTNYAAREKATLDIRVAQEDAPLEASLNISVQDAWLAQLEDSVQQNNFPPADNFSLGNWIALNRDDLSATDIDLFMVAAKSSYKNAVHHYNDSAEFRFDDNNRILNLVGKITGKKDAPVKDREITVMSKNTRDFFIDVDTTKADGSFIIPLPQNMDSLSLSLQVKDKHDVVRDNAHITIDSFAFPVFETPASLKKQFLTYNLQLITSLRKYHLDTVITFQGKGWLKPIIVRTVQSKPLNYDESKRINTISQILTSDKFRYGGKGAISNALLTVPGVSLLHGDIVIFGFTPTIDWAGVLRPLLVVDGVAMGDASLGYFDELSPADIDFIEVLRGAEAAIYGMRGAGGVIAVNTRHGPPREDLSKNNFFVFTPVTYHACPQFYMPDYSVPEIKQNQVPDPRTTIYWSGNITTDAMGRATVNFYTADNATNYSVTISGITAKGDVVYKRVLMSRN